MQRFACPRLGRSTLLMKALSPRNIIVLAMLVGILSVAKAAQAVVIYDESVSGDLFFGINGKLTQLTLNVGSNEVVGLVGPSPFDVFDPFSFIILPGQNLDALILVALVTPTAITLFAGPSAEVPNDIGGVLAQPSDVGQDLLPLMTIPSPLAEGTYSARLFAGFDFAQPYHLDFRVSVVPEPGTFFLAVIGFGSLLCLTRLKRPKEHDPRTENRV